MASFLFALVWSAAVVLSVALFALSTSVLSRGIFVLAALVAMRQVVYGPRFNPNKRERHQR